MRILFDFQERDILDFSSIAAFGKIRRIKFQYRVAICCVKSITSNAQLLVGNQSLIAVDSIRASVDCVEHGRINQAKRGTFYMAGGCTENSRVHASIKAIW